MVAGGRNWMASAARVLAQHPALSTACARGGSAPRAMFPAGRLPAWVCGEAAPSRTWITEGWRGRFVAVPRTGAAAAGVPAHVRSLAVLGRGTALMRSAPSSRSGGGGDGGSSDGSAGARGGDAGRRKYHFRQYQGWEGDGPKPPIWTLLTRPLVFAGADPFPTQPTNREMSYMCHIRSNAALSPLLNH